MKINITFKLIVAIVISELAGIIGSIFTVPAIPKWYANIAKPQLAPPNWVFGPVWTTLFALMGVAAYLVWDKRLERRDAKIALTVFALQLILNVLWSFIFFGLRSPGAAVIEIICLWLAILATIFFFYRISKPAAWLFAPYILWVTFAGFLNFGIWQLNRRGVDTANIPLPQGYTLEKYQIAEMTTTTCIRNAECSTPPFYLLRSNCPYTSLCINKKCAVVCPTAQSNSPIQPNLIKPTPPGGSPIPSPTTNQKITVTGIVMSKSSNTLITPPFSFVLSAAGKTYTVVLENATSKNTIVINSRNVQVGNNFIQVANTVTVTGTLNGSTITATVIQVPTTKDEGA